MFHFKRHCKRSVVFLRLELLVGWKEGRPELRTALSPNLARGVGGISFVLQFRQIWATDVHQLSGRVSGHLPPSHLLFQQAMSSHHKVAGHSALLLYPIVPAYFRPSTSARWLPAVASMPISCSPASLLSRPCHIPRDFFLNYWSHHANISLNILSVASCSSGKTCELLGMVREACPELHPTKKATALSVPHPGDSGPHTDTHFLPIPGLPNGRFLPFSWTSAPPLSVPSQSSSSLAVLGNFPWFIPKHTWVRYFQRSPNHCKYPPSRPCITETASFLCTGTNSDVWQKNGGEFLHPMTLKSFVCVCVCVCVRAHAQRIWVIHV